jgi:ADP-ribose pyrophosphatase
VNRLGRADLVDACLDWPVRSTDVLAEGKIARMVQDHVGTPAGDEIAREYLQHPGAVAVIALDEELRVALVRQYRHPVRYRLIEPPAGLLDIDGEDYLAAAQRELAEEVDLGARVWHVLVDPFSSPGITAEALRIYLARDLYPVSAPEGFLAEGEEADMDTVWASLEDLVDGVLAGDLHNPSLVSGVLAAWTALHRGGFDTLRPGDAPWPPREVAKS